MTSHLHTDGLGESPALPTEPVESPALPTEPVASTDPARPAWTATRNARMAAHKIECNACPVLCQISDGKVGACDRYANQAGVLVREIGRAHV